MQRSWVRVVITVVVGIVAGWGGYRLGHLAGWSANADWPATIGGGTGTVLLAVGLAVVAAVSTSAALTRWARRRGD